MEKNVGGYNRIARAVLGPVLIVVGATSLAGFLTIAAGTLGLVIAVAALLVGAALVTTAVIQKCPSSDPLGVDTYGGATATEIESAGRPHAQ